MNESKPISDTQSLQPLTVLNPIFLRMPSKGNRELWPGSGLNYWKLRRLISPGTWNEQKPSVRAYELRKIGRTRGMVFIEHADLIDWYNKQFQRSNPASPVLSPPQISLPPTLTIPATGKQCPYTQLRHTVMYELSQLSSPYGQTGIYFTPLLLPGRTHGRIAMQTPSVLQFIRSCPPPKYKISPETF